MSDADATPPGLTFDRIREAEERISGIARRTPVLTSSTLDAEVDGTVLLKAEMFQRSGAFKFRGAFNRLSLLDLPERDQGVVAYSSGNHGGAVALAARLLGIRAVVVVPSTGSAAKLAAVAGYGAEMVQYDPAAEQREEVAAAIAADRGMTIIAPFDDYDIMAGQGTAGLELAVQAGPEGIDQVLVPVGGGGLAAGVATAIKGLLPAARIIGVEPSAADDTARSFRAGHRVSIPPPASIADGLLAEQPGELTFAVNSVLLDDVVTVPEVAITEAMAFCFTTLKVVAEPSAAVPLAALRTGVVPGAGRRTAVILSGGNITPAALAALVPAPQPAVTAGDFREE
jgi:threonine dehydratase